MNIKIDNNYSLKSDPRNVVLIENKVSEKGTEYESTIGYYGTVESALKGYLKHKNNTSEATSINQLLNEIKETRKTIESVLGGSYE